MALAATLVAGLAGAPGQAGALELGGAEAPLVLVLGSSTPAGLGASLGGRRWSSLAAQYLGWREDNLALGGSGLGQAPGDRQPLPPAPFRSHALARRPAVAWLMHGANENLLRVPPHGPGGFAEGLEANLAWFRAELKACRVACILPQDAPLLRPRRAAYDAAVAELAASWGVGLVDGRQGRPPEGEDFCLPDRLHLQDLGHAALGAWVARAMCEAGLAEAKAATGGQEGEASELLAPGTWWLDGGAALGPGPVEGLAGGLKGPGRVRFGLWRPDGRGEHWLVALSPWRAATGGPWRAHAWWAQAGDRLGLQVEGRVLGALPGAPLALPLGPPGPATPRLALRCLPKEALHD